MGAAEDGLALSSLTLLGGGEAFIGCDCRYLMSGLKLVVELLIFTCGEPRTCATGLCVGRCLCWRVPPCALPSPVSISSARSGRGILDPLRLSYYLASRRCPVPLMSVASRPLTLLSGMFTVTLTVCCLPTSGLRIHRTSLFHFSTLISLFCGIVPAALHPPSSSRLRFSQWCLVCFIRFPLLARRVMDPDDDD